MTTPFRRPPSKQQIETLQDVFRRLVDKSYASRDTITLLRGFDVRPNTRLWRALNDMEARARETEDVGRRLLPTDPVIVEVGEAFRLHLMAQRRLFDAAARKIEDDGARAGSLLAKRLTLGSTDSTSIMPEWVTPDIRSLRRVIDYTNKPAWQAFLDDYPDDLKNSVVSTLARDFTLGLGPVASARHLRELVENLPRHAANNKLRTLQMTALRDAQAVEYTLNSTLISHVIRIATFDTRVCAACLALHGSKLLVGQRVDGHHQCRCTSLAVLRMQTKERVIEPGEDWLRRQPQDVQLAVIGRANLKAWQDGRLKLEDFVGERNDPVFGRQIVRVKPTARRTPPPAPPKPAAPPRTSRRRRTTPAAPPLPAGIVPPAEWKKTTQAEAFVKNRWPHLDQVSFKGLHIDNVRDIYEAANEMALNYPDQFAELRALKTGSLRGRRNTLAFYTPRSAYTTPTITFVPRQYKDNLTHLPRVAGPRSNGNPRWTVGGANPYSVFIHEFGHHHDYMLREQLQNIAVTKQVSLTGVGRLVNLLTDWQARNKPGLDLGEYSRSNRREAWAEGFSQRLLEPRSRWTDFTRKMDDLINYIERAPRFEAGEWKVVDVRDMTDAERAEQDALKDRWDAFGYLQGQSQWLGGR